MNLLSKFISTLSISLLAGLFFTTIHPDLIHTSLVSSVYYQEHTLDLYDYSRLYIREAAYLPSIYLIFAAWNTPLYLINELSFLNTAGVYDYLVGNVPANYQFFWDKFLLIIFLYLSCKELFKIEKILLNNSYFLYTLSFIFFSPIVFFSIFIFGGYDIFAVFFTLLGLRYYLNRKLFKYIFVFSFAITFKFFALFVFLPLFLYDNFSIQKKLLYFPLIFLFCGLYFLFHNDSIYFLKDIGLMIGRKTSSETSLISYLQIFSIVIYFLFNLLIFYLRHIIHVEYNKKHIFIIFYLASIFIFFVTPFSPHWLILFLPAQYLIFSLIRSKHVFLFLSYFFLIILIFLIAEIWRNNIDYNLLSFGFLSNHLSTGINLNDFYNISLLNFFGFQISIFLLFFFFQLFFLFPLLIYFFENKFQFKFNLKFIDRSIYINSFIYLQPIIFFILLALPYFFADSRNQMNLYMYVFSSDKDKIFYLHPGAEACQAFSNRFDSLKVIEIPKIVDDLMSQYYFVKISTSKNSYQIDNFDIKSRSIQYNLDSDIPKGSVATVCIKNMNSSDQIPISVSIDRLSNHFSALRYNNEITDNILLNMKLYYKRALITNE